MSYWNIFYILSVSGSIISFLLIPSGILRLLEIKNKTHINFWIIAVQLHCLLILLTLSIFSMGIAGLFMTSEANKDETAVSAYYYGNYVATLSSNSLMLSFVFIFLERSVATATSKTYEKSHKWLFLIAGSHICWLYGIGHVLCWNVGKFWVSKWYLNLRILVYVDISILTPITYAVSSFVLLCTLVLWKMNQKLKKKRSSSSLVLSYRYQVCSWKEYRGTNQSKYFWLLTSVYLLSKIYCTNNDETYF